MTIFWTRPAGGLRPLVGEEFAKVGRALFSLQKSAGTDCVVVSMLCGHCHVAVAEKRQPRERVSLRGTSVHPHLCP